MLVPKGDCTPDCDLPQPRIDQSSHESGGSQALSPQPLIRCAVAAAMTGDVIATSAGSPPTSKDERSTSSSSKTPSLATHVREIPAMTSLTSSMEPSSSLLRLVLLNAVICGVEVCVGTAFSYVAPMLLKGGLDEEHVSYVMGVGPLLGLFLVPVIGRRSDRCTSRYGRRRPFIVLLSLFLVASLILVPYSDAIASMLGGGGESGQGQGQSHKGGLSLGVLVLGVVLLDFAGQAFSTPCEALLFDTCRQTERQARAFAIYSFMLSLGGCIGYFIAAMDWEGSSLASLFGTQEQCAFFILLVFFTVCLVTSLSVAREVPYVPSLADNYSSAGHLGNSVSSNGIGSSSNSDLPHYVFHHPKETTTTDRRSSLTRLLVHLTRPCWTLNALGCHFFIRAISCFRRNLNRAYRDVSTLPLVLRGLLYAHCTSWTAVMTFSIYYTDYMGQAVYGGSPDVPSDHALRHLYDEGVRVASWGLLLHCCLAGAYSCFIERLVSRWGISTMYMAGMTSFVVSIAVMLLSRNVYVINTMAALTGVAYASLTSLPYMLVAMYHEQKEVFFADRLAADGTTASRGIATDLSILNSAYFVSLVILSLTVGSIVSIAGSVRAYMSTAAVVGAVSCVYIWRVVGDKQALQQLLHPHHISRQSPVSHRLSAN